MNITQSFMIRASALPAIVAMAITGCQRANDDKPQIQEQRGIAVVADDPVPFGYKCAWLAIQSDNPDAVVRALGLTGVRKCGWKVGVDAAYNGDVFVTPRVKDWVLVASFGLPEDATKVRTMIESLGKEFSDVQYFGTHRVVEYHSWARVLNRKLVRHYAFVGDRGETLCDVGEPTNEERKLGLIFNDTKSPNEQHVMDLAAAWSIDPTTLDQQKLEKGVGHLGSLAKK